MQDLTKTYVDVSERMSETLLRELENRNIKGVTERDAKAIVVAMLRDMRTGFELH